jgi:hypothetical protein
MRDNHHWEDENELPYMLWEMRDDDSASNGGDYGSRYAEDESYEQRLEEILDSMDITFAQHINLKGKLMSFLDAMDCTGLEVGGGYDEYSFKITRENEYIKTVDEFVYYPAFGTLKRVFNDCYTTHYHDNLLKNPRFRNLVGAKGLEFLRCAGGYESKYLMADDEFILLDEIDVGVYFRAGSKERRYTLDLDRMELSKDYMEFNI